MATILIKHPLPKENLDRIHREFPRYPIIIYDYKASGIQQNLNRVEILYGSSLTPSELSRIPRLRWIHSPEITIDQFCLDEIKIRKNITITTSKEKDLCRAGEFVMGAILAFGKNLIYWSTAPHHGTEMWDSPIRQDTWTLKGKKFLQIGLGSIGTEITRQAKQLGMLVWGAQHRRTFHPHCHKIFQFQALHSILPNTDIVSISIPRDKMYHYAFKIAEMKLMKQNSILIITGSGDVIDGKELETVVQTGKFKGVLVDTFEPAALQKNSILWKTPRVIITPKVALIPIPSPSESFSTFIYNMRHFSLGDINQMKNLIPLTAT